MKANKPILRRKQELQFSLVLMMLDQEWSYLDSNPHLVREGSFFQKKDDDKLLPKVLPGKLPKGKGKKKSRIFIKMACYEIWHSG